MLVALRVHEHIAHVFTCTVCHSNSSFSNTRKSTPRNLPLWHVVFANVYMRCGARCGCIDHADRVHAGKAAKSWCLQTERAPGSVSSICNHFITGAAHGHSSSRERLHFASSFSTYLLRELLHCHRSFQTRHCPVHRRCPRGAGRAPDPACRSAHAPFGRAARRTHRAQRPALRHNHRRAGASPDAPLLGRLRAP